MASCQNRSSFKDSVSKKLVNVREVEEEWGIALQLRKKETQKDRHSMGAVGREHKTVRTSKILILLLREQLVTAGEQAYHGRDYTRPVVSK